MKRLKIMTSREQILSQLRSKQKPFQNTPQEDSYLHMVPVQETDKDSLKKRFITEAEKLASKVYEVQNKKQAGEQLYELIKNESKVSCWDEIQILLEEAIEKRPTQKIEIADPLDPSVQVGISGAEAALAATGSLVICSGNGKPRTTSLLPPVHIVILNTQQILPDLESWMALQKSSDLSKFSKSSNICIISGPSRTADIAMELIMGMHGPKEMHIILIDDV